MNKSGQTRLRRWWWSQQFSPGVLGTLLNPFFFARRGLIEEMCDLFLQFRGEVLDVGCGRKPYRDLVPTHRYVGVDLDTPELRAIGAADIFYDGSRIPVADESFDGVICSQVLEHIFEPSDFLIDIKRVLRPGGLLLLTTPFVWDEHSQPYDFGRYSSFGLRYVLEKAGYEVVVQRKTCADCRALVQLAAAYVYKITRSRHRPVNWLTQLAVIAPINIVGGLLARIVPGNPDFFLDNVVLARKPASDCFGAAG